MRVEGVHRGADIGPQVPASPLGLHRVIEPAGVLPQAAWRLDPEPGASGPMRY